jgi:hypothetical protein
VNADDDHPYWYPHQTRGGSIREERLIFPLTPGESWESAKPVVLPEDCRKPAELVAAEAKQLAMSKAEKRERAKRRREQKQAADEAVRPTYRTVVIHGRPKKVLVRTDPTQTVTVAKQPEADEAETPRKPRESKKTMKFERNAVAFCRELRDRWQRRVAEEPWMLEANAAAKYEVARLADHGPALLPTEPKRLAA